MQYFAQDEATRLDPVKTVYETMEADSPVGMVPMIRNILGGFLFSGDDIYKTAGVLSGGERTRLAVARMLLRPANTLLLDEPTNHLDLDSKDVLLEALEDFGGTLDLRLARPLLRRQARHQDRRGRATAASRSTRAPTSSSSGAARRAARRRPGRRRPKPRGAQTPRRPAGRPTGPRPWPVRRRQADTAGAATARDRRRPSATKKRRRQRLKPDASVGRPTIGRVGSPSSKQRIADARTGDQRPRSPDGGAGLLSTIARPPRPRSPATRR